MYLFPRPLFPLTLNVTGVVGADRFLFSLKVNYYLWGEVWGRNLSILLVFVGPLGAGVTASWVLGPFEERGALTTAVPLAHFFSETGPCCVAQADHIRHVIYLPQAPEPWCLP